MPTMSVTAKPLTGPVPYCARMRPEMRTVTWPSMIDGKALS